MLRDIGVIDLRLVKIFVERQLFIYDFLVGFQLVPVAVRDGIELRFLGLVEGQLCFLEISSGGLISLADL